MHHIDKEKVSYFKERLESMLIEYVGFVQRTTNDLKLSDDSKKGYSQHQADGDSDDVSLQISNEERKIVQQIMRALRKIEEGSYGICDITGENIPISRLEAIPYANITVGAQQMLEQGLLG